jgi:regulator of protease activity HflC (stomatin/prohibitin superfamily)
MKIFWGAVTISFLFSACSIVRPGEVGIKSRLGKLTQKTSNGGIIFFNPFVAKVIKVPTRTINREMMMNLPSKEGLTINSEISILYHVKEKEVSTVISEIGLSFDQIITAIFRSAASDICAQYYAKDMHSGERKEIEKRIKDLMNENLEQKGFVIEAVLLKSISLPPGLSKAIEMKLEAEQEALRMEFVKQQEEREAERQLIRAEGRKKAQIVEAEARAKVMEIEAEATKLANLKLNESLTEQVLKMNQIEALFKLSNSANAKIIFLDSKNPFMNLIENK